ncbi:MAG: NDP-sugar synthase [Acidimicrobiales bacterium]|nr:NDP-sugar synthase [Acidimicrobiales bacterium]
MKAVVLVGGFGTRLRPLTFTTPKNLLPVVHVPMVERVIAHLAEHGVTDVVLSMGYKPDTFVAAYPDGMCGDVALTYAVEDEPLDTAGAIRFAAGEGGIDERFVVVNGDVLTDLDLTRLVRFHDASGAEGTIALHDVDDPSRYGVVVTDVAGRVEAFVEKPDKDDAPSTEINAGTYVFEPSVLGRIDGGRPVSVERETFPDMVESGSLYALDGDAYWLDAGTPETYLQANLDLLPADGEGAIHESADIVETAHIERSVVAAGARVGDEVTLTEAIILDGAVVEAGARVHRSIVGPRATIRAGAELLDLTVIGHDVDIEPDARLKNERIPQDDR